MTIDCPWCKITIEYESNIVGEYANDNPLDIMASENYALVKCPQCRKPIVALRKAIFELGGFDYGMPARIFPSREFHINNEIPVSLKDALLEAIGCYEAKLYTAAATMCRRTIDGFCTLKGASGNLSGALRKLKESGAITEDIYMWADELRLSGNDAAHDVEKTIAPEDAKDILDFTIAILDYTFSYKEKFEAFVKRKKK